MNVHFASETSVQMAKNGSSVHAVVGCMRGAWKMFILMKMVKNDFVHYV